MRKYQVIIMAHEAGTAKLFPALARWSVVARIEKISGNYYGTRGRNSETIPVASGGTD